MPRKRKHSPELVDAACRIWAQKTTYKSLARSLKVKPSELNYILNTLGKDILKNYEIEYGRECERIYQSLQISNGEANGAHT